MSKLEQYLRSLNPTNELGKPKLIFGRKYSCYFREEYIGTYTWTEDENIGSSFQKEVVDEFGDKFIQVGVADDWKLLE